MGGGWLANVGSNGGTSGMRLEGISPFRAICKERTVSPPRKKKKYLRGLPHIVC